MNDRRTQTYLPDGTSWRYGYDRLSQAVPETPSYDADWNMLTNGGWTYAWNAQDRLASAAKGAIRLEFAYDYMGRRFEKKVYENNVLTKRSLYAYDGFKQIAEYDALDNNALLNTYLWQPEGLDVPLLRNGSEFYVSDANKNVVALMDTTGAVTDTYVYDPFGNCAHAGTSANPFRFSSEYHDDETDLVYYNYRYYSPELGRWISRDSIGEEGGINLYVMIDNNPLTFMDKHGLRRWYVTGLHSYIIVETWNDKCKPNGYVRIEFGAAYNSWQTWLTVFMFARGCVYITPVSGHDNWYTYQMDTCCKEDMFLLEWARKMEEDPPWYNAPAFNCHAFTLYAWTVGLSE